MGTIMSTGQITIVDLTDQRTSSFYLQADRSKIQTYNVNTKIYSPNYVNEQITITPAFFFGNEDYSTKIEKGDIFYYINGSSDYAAKYEPDATPSGDCYQKGVNLIIAQNIGEGTLADDVLRIRAVINKDAITDEATSLGNAEISAIIEFAKVISGADGSAGISVTNVEQQYILSGSSTQAPVKDNSDWSSTNPTWEENKYLWIRTKITYSNGNVEYTEPYCDSSWKAAADGVAGLNKEIEDINAAMKDMQAEIDGAIETWYMTGDPTAEGFVNPWTEEEGDTAEVRERHIGDLYFDTNTGISYRYFKDGETYKWQPISDEVLADAVAKIEGLRTDVDNKVKIFYGETIPSNPRADDMWIKDDGSLWQYTGTEWILSSYSVDKVVIEYATSSSNTTPPTEGWGVASPEWNADIYVWQRTVTYYKANIDPDFSEPVCISAAAARSITISGEQVFKSADGSTYTPASITLTAITVGGLTAGKWYYKNGTTWVDANKTGESFAITPGHVAFGSGTTATIKVVAAESDKYYDVISLYKVADGQNGDDGAPASSVFLTNENITFAGDVDGQVAATSIKCNVVAYTGTEKVTPTVGDITSIDGMTITKGSVINNEVPITITITDKATLGGSGAQSGTLSVPITSPVNTTLYITWSKVNTGATGANGADAIFAIVESTSGKVVFTDADSGDITLKASLYIGGAVQTSGVSYSWTSIPAGTDVTGTDQTLVVSRDKVPSARSFVCIISYNEKTYTDSIALSDKTDAVYCVIESSAGDKFTNHVINTDLTCRVFDGYGEVDQAGTIYTYTWERYNAKGLKDEAWTKTGKTIEVTSADVTAKAIFSCKITK